MKSDRVEFFRYMKNCSLAAFFALSVSTGWAANTVTIDVDCKNPTVPLSPHLYGLFFEDINYAADGGLYAELVQNRSFEYCQVGDTTMPPLFSWESVGDCTLSVENDQPLNEHNTNYLKLDIERKGGDAGVANSGFDGIPLDAGAKYDFSCYVRKGQWTGSGTVRVTLEANGIECGAFEFSDMSKGWKKIEGVIVSDQTVEDARLVITTQGRGDLYLDMVSLFPQDTFLGRKNGMRKDLAQALKDLNPKFLRFPGGCIAHGDCLDNVYRWKDTVGDVAERKPNWNLWGYHQTYGLGYFEYFQLCEDIGASPLPVIPVGVSCGFHGPKQEAVALDELQPWIDDAFDLIEFANGAVDTEWGAVRAEMGHPEPFSLEFIALGNEPHDNALFRDRFPFFVKAIREKHPEIKIVGTSGLGPRIPIYDLMTEMDVYSSDEHYYMPPQWFIDNQHRFDNFDRSRPKIFVGEYASKDKRLFNAVAEAAYLTGIERNGDIVDMTCYAPLFGNVRHCQWNPDLIYFDHRTVVKTPSYYVQQLFAGNKGDVYLANDLQYPEDEAPATRSGSVGIGTWNTTIEIENVAVNGNPIDPSDWKVFSGDFELNGKKYAQRNARVAPAVSQGDREFGGQIVTYTLRARKTGGDEGFLIVFGRQADNNSYWWNIGGWGNTRHAIQFGPGNNKSTVAETAGSIETDRWYDIKVVLSPGNIKCWLDGQLIHDYNILRPVPSISATLDKASGEVIIKLVNTASETIDAAINLNGVESVAPEAKRTLLAGARDAQNTIDSPDAVKPETSTMQVGTSFDCTLPPTSVQFIRVSVK